MGVLVHVWHGHAACSLSNRKHPSQCMNDVETAKRVPEDRESATKLFHANEHRIGMSRNRLAGSRTLRLETTNAGSRCVVSSSPLNHVIIRTV